MDITNVTNISYMSWTFSNCTLFGFENSLADFE